MRHMFTPSPITDLYSTLRARGVLLCFARERPLPDQITATLQWVATQPQQGSPSSWAPPPWGRLEAVDGYHRLYMSPPSRR